MIKLRTNDISVNEFIICSEENNSTQSIKAIQFVRDNKNHTFKTTIEKDDIIIERMY